MDQSELLRHFTALTQPMLHTIANVASLARSLSGVSHEHGLELLDVDVSAAKSPQDIVRAFAVSLRFPSYARYNWEALRDCLSDLSWWPALKYVLFVRGFDVVVAHMPSEAVMLVDVLNAAADEWHEVQTPFHVAIEITEFTRPVVHQTGFPICDHA